MEAQDSFTSARHLLLEVMAEQEGCSLLDSKRGVQASHRHYSNEHDCRGLVLDSLAIQAAFKLGVQGIGFHLEHTNAR